MATFSLEKDGDKIQCRKYGEDPFVNASDQQCVVEKSKYLENISDISDDDFEIPSSQRVIQPR